MNPFYLMHGDRWVCVGLKAIDNAGWMWGHDGYGIFNVFTFEIGRLTVLGLDIGRYGLSITVLGFWWAIHFRNVR